MDLHSVLIMKRKTTSSPAIIIHPETLWERILSFIAPLQLPQMTTRKDREGLHASSEYHARMNRRGIEPKRSSEDEPDFAWGRIIPGSARKHERKLNKWEKLERKLRA